ncbi:MAG: XRE family transcriptional regulator [Candidatus Acidiferrum sp.]
MNPEYREIRLRQLSRSLAAFEVAKSNPRPQLGWLRAVREALGLTLDRVGKNMHATRQRIKNFEDAEKQDRITLASLRRVAEAMGCELVYAIVPKSGTIAELAEKPAVEEATKRVLAVEHTMSLENQAAGNVDETIAAETKRILQRPRS